MSGAPFSRIALAAALLEYDNDPDDPIKPKRSAQESAIFAHLRRSGPVPKPESVLEYDDLPEPRRSKDFLKVPLPSDDASLFAPMEPTLGSRASIDGRRSLDVLREHGEQFFQSTQEEESEESHSDDDVDLGSWGLDTFIPPKSKPKEKPAKRPGPSRVRPASEHLDNPPNAQSPQSISYSQDAFNFANDPSSARPRARQMRTRTSSFMNDLGFSEDGSKGPIGNAFSKRPQTSYISSNLEDPVALESRPHSMMDLRSVPFPTSRPGTPGPDFGTGEEAEDSKFVVPLPPPERLSKFDPKAARRARTESVGSWLSDAGLKSNAEARSQTLSNLSMGSPRQRDENDPGASGRPLSMAPSYMPENRRLSKMELLRPKVLIMPSPLRDVNNVQVRSKTDFRAREGFQETTGDRPLPAGFRESTLAARPGVRPPVGPQSSGKLPNSALFMSDSRMSLSASQLMFRNSLMVDGQYLEDDKHMGRAHVDGEKIEMYGEDPEEVEAAYRELHHPTGKLHGHSLIDALTARKDEIKGKKRSVHVCSTYIPMLTDYFSVFTGDGRHSMMDRGPATRSTLIDPSTFDKPQIAVVDGEGRPINLEANRQISDGDRRRSAGPLVDLNGVRPGLRAGMRTSQSRTSVFGVDTVWEREMSRLKKMEAENEADTQLHENQIQKKLKGKPGDMSFSTTLPNSAERMTSETAGTNMLTPPTLPNVTLVTSRPRPRMPKVSDNGSDEGHGAAERRRVSTATLGVKGWFAGSDDEDDRRPSSRITGRFGPSSNPQAPRLPPVTGDSEDEDVPLSRIKPTLKVSRSDSDEDEPLVKTKSRLGVDPPTLNPEPNPTPIETPEPRPMPMNDNEDEDEDDNVPLGLRASVNLHTSDKPSVNPGGDEEDETPLGLRYAASASPNASEHQRQQQMAMMLVQQQQQQAQQQMYLQQMARQSMAGFSNINGAGLMAPAGFPAFGAAPSMGMFGVTAPGPAGIPMVNNADTAKIGRVDAWRKSVAAEPSF